MKEKASAKEVVEMLLHFTVAEPPHRQVIMSNLSYLDANQKAKIRDEIMFLDIVVFGSLMETEAVKNCWPTSERIFVGYLASLKETLEITGGGFDGLLRSLEARWAAYKPVLQKPLNVARFEVGKTFATLGDIENDWTVEIAGTGEFVSVVNYFGDLVDRYEID